MAAAAREGYTTATAVADALVRRGVPFRVAHHVVGSLVANAEREGIGLDKLSDEAITTRLGEADDETARALAKDEGIGQALRDAASIEGALVSADVIGGTAPGRVAEALRAARDRLDSTP
jgi:argininosuccinate lyase